MSIQILSTIMNNYLMVQKLNFADIGAKMYFFEKFPAIIVLEDSSQQSQKSKRKQDRVCFSYTPNFSLIARVIPEIRKLEYSKILTHSNIFLYVSHHF